MADPIFNRSGTLETSSWDAAAVTPNDDADLPRAPCQGLWVSGGDGTITVVMAGGATVSYGGISDGSILPFRVDRVMATGTGATGIVALYEN